MNNPALTPGSVEELVQVVRCSPSILAIGNGTKPRLSRAGSTKVSLAQLRGILEYEPSEFTFTALAGTPVRDLAEALAARGQYLPFDPLLVDSGATLGGTVAAGLSGPGRFRFGGVREFILGARFIDGAGRLLRSGGKVVKNAAGFDLPKFFIGSLGRFGVLVELTFKVFPVRASSLTCRLRSDSVEGSVRLISEIARSRFEADAIDLPPDGNGILVRLAGPARALEQMTKDLLSRWAGERVPDNEAERVWGELRELGWSYPNGPLIKVALAADDLCGFHGSLSCLEGRRVHISSAGNVAMLSLPDGTQVGSFSHRLAELGLSGLALRGEAPLWLGVPARPQIIQAVKNALDPAGRFPGLDE